MILRQLWLLRGDVIRFHLHVYSYICLGAVRVQKKMAIALVVGPSESLAFKESTSSGNKARRAIFLRSHISFPRIVDFREISIIFFSPREESNHHRSNTTTMEGVVVPYRLARASLVDSLLQWLYSLATTSTVLFGGEVYLLCLLFAASPGSLRV